MARRELAPRSYSVPSAPPLIADDPYTTHNSVRLVSLPGSAPKSRTPPHTRPIAARIASSEYSPLAPPSPSLASSARAPPSTARLSDALPLLRRQAEVRRRVTVCSSSAG